jgi:hypothetical protein
MSLGPVEYVILGFPGNQFTGQIVPELAAALAAYDQHLGLTTARRRS